MMYFGIFKKWRVGSNPIKGMALVILMVVSMLGLLGMLGIASMLTHSIRSDRLLTFRRSFESLMDSLKFSVSFREVCRQAFRQDNGNGVNDPLITFPAAAGNVSIGQIVIGNRVAIRSGQAFGSNNIFRVESLIFNVQSITTNPGVDTLYVGQLQFEASAEDSGGRYPLRMPALSLRIRQDTNGNITRCEP